MTSLRLVWWSAFWERLPCVSSVGCLLVPRWDDGIPPAYLITGDDSPVAVYVAAVRCDCSNEAEDLGQAVDGTTLSNSSGGTSVAQNTTLTGTLSNDSANHIASGDNVIAGNALAGEAGIPVVIQNSGSNVLIQNATVLNVEFKP